jgi:siroheme synthase
VKTYPICLVSVTNLLVIVQRLLKNGYSPDTPAAMIQDGTTAHQKVVEGTLENIVERSIGIEPPASSLSVI